jgi:hypothetical protein
LQAIATQVWRRPDLDLRAQTPLDPAQLAAALSLDTL